mmetsp:Transcript_9381/g.13562  ORF Transcript_9381/g.13562 Transcript_9381/m.13562 type:complete len:80 (-) Transcript_9381:511-750(-)
MMQYKLDILAVQEHRPCNRARLDNKQLQACHRETQIYNDGRIISSQFEISENSFATFVPVYGIPHSGGEKLKEHIDENT